MARPKSANILEEVAQKAKEELDAQEASGALNTHPAFTISNLGGEWVVTKHLVNPSKGEVVHKGTQKYEAVERFKIAVGNSGILS